MGIKSFIFMYVAAQRHILGDTGLRGKQWRQ